MRKLFASFRRPAHDETVDAVIDPEFFQARPKRKSQLRLWRRPSVMALGVVAMAGLAGGAWFWTIKSGLAEETLTQLKWSAIKVSADHGFTVQDVLVTGRTETDRAALLDALSVARGAPILAYDFAAAKARVEALPWVLQARIERLLPNTIAVHLIERRPIALWQSQGLFALIDEEGRVITREGLGRFSTLIQVVGQDAPTHVGGLLELLETQPALKKQVKAAVRVGGRRWDLMLESGVSVRLPEDGAPQALARLVDFERETGVLARDVRVLDLRIPDRVIVGRDGVHQPKAQPNKPGQDT